PGRRADAAGGRGDFPRPPAVAGCPGGQDWSTAPASSWIVALSLTPAPPVSMTAAELTPEAAPVVSARPLDPPPARPPAARPPPGGRRGRPGRSRSAPGPAVPPWSRP